MLAIWGYALPGIKGNQKASQLIQDLRFGEDQLGPYWNERRMLVDQHYVDIKPDEALFQDITRSQLLAYTESNIQNFVGFLAPLCLFYLLEQVTYLFCKTLNCEDKAEAFSHLAWPRIRSTGSLEHYQR